jgi:ATP-dependent DNA ligase
MSVPEPMLAAAVDGVPAADALPGGTVWEPKFDGFRAFVSVGERVTITSRRGKDLTQWFPDVADAAGSQLSGRLLLDGELVVWAERRFDFTALQQRLVAGRRLAELVAERPASLVAFDLLTASGEDLMERPWRQRRARLEAVMADTRAPLQLCPATTDREEALVWYDAWAALGIEGLVAKGQGQPYVPGRRGWLKVRHRHGAEAVVGAVIGRLEVPERLVLGAFDDAGVLRVVGSTGPLDVGSAQAVGAVLSPPQGGPHPWPTQLPSVLLGGLAGRRPARAVALADPSVVVEVSVDTAFDRGRWRHLARFVRLRPDVDARDVTVAGLAGPS